MNESPKSSEQGDSTPLANSSINSSEGMNVTSEGMEVTWDDVEKELATPNASIVEVEQPIFSENSSARFPQGSFHESLHSSSPLMLVETAFLASAASLIWLVNFYFPMGPILRLFFSVPIALIYLRWGNRAAWMGTLVSGLLLSVLMGPPRSLLYIMPFGLMGVLLGMLWRRKASWAVSISIGALLGAIGFFFRIWLISLLLGDDLWQYTTVQITDLIDWICIRLNLAFQPSLPLIQALMLVMIFINNLIYLFVVHLVCWFLFDRLHNPIPRPPKWVQVIMEYDENK
ncbi:DUF2232 domain-containing protein [Leptolyngbya sp. Cla-17]|uniref:DUF2232 domain-containing protein n=1 Tax=Leptolyngbya sp. Cla-17 TaxID=2803751 RepID=UPI0018D67670|nr:DUF2232 domain-containing protein [Leptolyngbya sp. Cla-17]